MASIEDDTYMTNHEAYKVLLKSLDIRFVNCTFTYKDAHITGRSSSSSTAPASSSTAASNSASTSSTSHKKDSKFKKLKNKLISNAEKVREVVTQERVFNDCVFVPIEDKDRVKDFVRCNFSKIRMSFEDCKFVKRESTWCEVLLRKLRQSPGCWKHIFQIEIMLNVSTEVNGTVKSTALINSDTFRVKDLPFLNQYCQEAIANAKP